MPSCKTKIFTTNCLKNAKFDLFGILKCQLATLLMNTRAGNGSMGHGSMGQMGHFFGWVTWTMGKCMLTHDPPLFYQPSESQ